MQAVPPFTIGVPSPDDAADLAAVHVRGWREAYGDVLSERFYDDAALQRRIRQWELITRWALERREQRVRVARDTAGTPVGFLLIGAAADEDAPRDVELQALYVISDWYGSGVSQALVEELLGGRPAMLWVVRENSRARRFYEKLGFRADGAVKTEPDLEDLADIRMVR